MASDIATLRVRVATDLSGFKSGMQEVHQTTQNAVGVMGRLGGAMTAAEGPSRAALLGVSALGAGLGLLAFKAVSAASNMEQTRIAYTTMLGSAKAANDFIAQLQHFAASTPFEFAGLTKSAQQLMAMGIDSKAVIPTLTALGDAMSGLGAGQDVLDRAVLALGQMQAKGKIAGGEMKQMAEAGVPVWKYLAKALGTDIPTAMKKVETTGVSAKVGIAAITAGMERDFGGMMDKQSHTVAGMWSNIQDAVGQGLTAIGTEITSALDIRGKMQGVMDFMTGFAARLQKFGLGGALVGTIGDIFGVAPEAIEGAVNSIGSAFRNLGSALTPVKSAVGDLARRFQDFVGPIIVAHLDVVMMAIGGAILGALVPALFSMAVAMGAAMLAIAPFIIAGAAVAAVAYLIINNWGTIYPKIKPILDALGELAQTVFHNIIIPAVKAAVWVFQNVLMPAVGALVGFFKRHWDDISGIVVAAVHIITALLKGDWGGAFNAIKDYFGRIVHLITHIFDGIHIPMPHFTAHGNMNPADWLSGKNVPGLDVKWYGSGLDQTFTRPTLIGVGDRGSERVQVTPAGTVGAGGGAGGRTILPIAFVPMQPSREQMIFIREYVRRLDAEQR